MAQTISTGMEAYACDGTKIGAVRRLFSAEAPAAAEAIDAGSTASSNLEANEFTQLSEIPATYNVGTAGSMGSGPARAAGIAPFPGPSGSGGDFAPSDTKYMEIRHEGMLHLHGESLYVPYSAVSSISETAVTLNCTREEAEQRYSTEPPALTGEPAAPRAEA
ncbi:MAG TPA: hypothetical protein VKX16_08720 [Chloroflexota bacterium]|nr:hypothetical protein [Chloroflexota bacterium]